MTGKDKQRYGKTPETRPVLDNVAEAVKAEMERLEYHRVSWEDAESIARRAIFAYLKPVVDMDQRCAEAALALRRTAASENPPKQ